MWRHRACIDAAAPSPVGESWEMGGGGSPSGPPAAAASAASDIAGTASCSLRMSILLASRGGVPVAAISTSVSGTFPSFAVRIASMVVFFVEGQGTSTPYDERF